MRTRSTRDAPALPALLTAQEVAATLRISVATVHRSIERGEIRAVSLGGRGGTRRIPVTEVERLLAANGADAERPRGEEGEAA